MATAELKAIISAEDKSKQAFSSFSNNVDGATGNIEKLGTSQQKFVNITNLASKATTGLGIGLLALGGVAIKNTIDSTMKFEQQMSDLSTLISGDSTQAIKQMSDGINGLLKVIPKSADELGASAYQIMSAGITDASKAISVLDSAGRLAVAGLGTTEEATLLLTKSINAFGLDANKSNEVANILFESVKTGQTTVRELAQSFGQVAPVAAAAGLKLDELQAATTALTVAGINTSEAQTSLKAAISNIISPSAEARKKAEELGLQFDIQSLKSKGLAGFLQEVKNKTGGNIESMGKLFGSTEALNAILALTGNQAKTFTDTLANMKSGTNNLNEAFNKQNESIVNQNQLLKNQLNVSYRELGVEIMPFLNNRMEDLIELLNRASNSMRTIKSQGWGQFFKDAGAGFNEIFISPVWKKLTGRAAGGILSGGQASIVGERGPELFIPTMGGRVIPNSQSAISVNVNVSGTNNFGSNMDVNSFGDMLGRQIQLALQGVS